MKRRDYDLIAKVIKGLRGYVKGTRPPKKNLHPDRLQGWNNYYCNACHRNFKSHYEKNACPSCKALNIKFEYYSNILHLEKEQPNQSKGYFKTPKTPLSKEQLVNSFSVVLKQENANFDSEKFRKSCGL